MREITITLETALQRMQAQCEDGSNETVAMVLALSALVRAASHLWDAMLPHDYDPHYTVLELRVDAFRELVQKITED